MRADSTPRRVEAERRFWSKVHKGDVCWNWTATLSHGYGTVTMPGFTTRRAHRIAYELLVGPIPDGLVIDHLCRNTRCVNPDHMEPVTIAVNNARGYGITAIRSRQTHCVHGHEFTVENIYTRPGRDAQRECRECHRIKRRKWKRRRYEKRLARFANGGVIWSDLSEHQRKHLAELGEIAERNDGQAYWTPVGNGEWQCAKALESRRLLLRNPDRVSHSYELTKLGLSVVREGDPQKNERHD